MRICIQAGVSLLAMACAAPAWAQTAASDMASQAETDVYSADIVVTAQRQSQRLQDVPIAVSAFSAESLDAQQIENSSDLQLSLPNITFTKTNFTGASFTIRGIGDLCVGVSCDSATGIHLNNAPLSSTRIAETEFFDLERVEVLRGPQGTLFGRNATSGVVNFITARPDLSGFGASGEAEYGNYQSIKLKGMINLPLGENFGLRIAGTYLNRDGFTRNLYDDSRIDGRDLYGLRASLRWEPSDRTSIDIMGYYFRENDDRMRIQKQRCQRDETGILGCLAGRLDAGVTNANATIAGVLSSREFFLVRGLPTAFALGSVYGTDTFAGVTSPQDVRTVSTDTTPSYFAEEIIGQIRLQHEFEGGLSLSLAGMWQRSEVDSSQDYNLSVQDRTSLQAGLNVLAAAAAGLAGVPASYFAPVAAALIPNGPNGVLCTSLPESTGSGAYGGNSECAMSPLDYDRSNQVTTNWSAEAILSSDWDGRFNFLIGGIYNESSISENSYYVNSFSLDYLSGVLGAFTALSSGLPPSYLGTPFYRNNTDQHDLRSYGLFGEAYFQLTDTVKITAGLRYNNDHKYVRARNTLLFDTTASSAGGPIPVLVPHGSGGLEDALNYAGVDFDPGIAGIQPFQERTVSFDEWTGRAVLDWQITPDNMVYASYSRGYKSGGINPPLSPAFQVSDSFDPEIVNAFEIGSKNQFGAMQLNLTAFFYQYKDLQLSRIVARTSVNDNVDADIWGVEAEAIIAPTRDLLVNISASYLHTEVSTDKYLANPRDPGGGRSDAVIIKDITNGSNCAVVPTIAGNAAGANGYVAAINGAIGLQAPVSFPADGGIASTGAFGICSALAASASTVGALFGGVELLNEGVTVNLRGNQLPQAPNVKFSIGAQYTIRTASDVTIVPRIDLTYTGDSYGSIFNGSVNSIDGYAQANAQIQVNGPDGRWFGRLFVQNIFDSDSVVGQYVTDQSSGLYTNIFTLDPRRYGVAVGFRF